MIRSQYNHCTISAPLFFALYYGSRWQKPGTRTHCRFNLISFFEITSKKFLSWICVGESYSQRLMIVIDKSAIIYREIFKSWSVDDLWKISHSLKDVIKKMPEKEFEGVYFHVWCFLSLLQPRNEFRRQNDVIHRKICRDKIDRFSTPWQGFLVQF